MKFASVMGLIVGVFLLLCAIGFAGTRGWLRPKEKQIQDSSMLSETQIMEICKSAFESEGIDTAELELYGWDRNSLNSRRITVRWVHTRAKVLYFVHINSGDIPPVQVTRGK